MVQVGEAALHQRADEIQGERRTFVPPQQQIRIRRAGFSRELGPVDEIAAIARQRESPPRLAVGRAWLGILPGHASHADDGLLQPMHEHEAHLQEDLQLLGDRVGLAVDECLGAVAALQQEGFAALGGSEPGAQFLDLPGHDDRRQAGDLSQDPLERLGVGIDRLLLGGSGLPAGAVPGSGFGRSHVIDPSTYLLQLRAGAADTSKAECAPFPRGPMHRVLILGAGKIGALISGLLAESSSYRVHLADVDGAAAEAVARAHGSRHLTPVTLDASNAAVLAKQLATHPVDAVISSLPYHCNVVVAEAARKARIHYFDLTEDVEVTRAVRAIAAGASQAFVPQCGLAPGFISIAAAELI